jgi:hypothetical protein
MATSKASKIIRKGPSGGKKSNDFIAVKEDEPVTIVPVLPTGEIFSIDLHAFWAVNPAVTFACIAHADDAGDGCPGCNLGDKAGYRAFLPVLDVDGDLKVFPFGISVERQLVTLEEELGEIVGLKLRVKRTGSGLSTKYQIINTGKTVDVEISSKKALDFVESKIEIKDKAQILRELREAGLMKGGKKVVEEESEEEEEEDEAEEITDEEEEEETPRKKVSKKVVEKPSSKKKVVVKGGKKDDWDS